MAISLGVLRDMAVVSNFWRRPRESRFSQFICIIVLLVLFHQMVTVLLAKTNNASWTLLCSVPSTGDNVNGNDLDNVTFYIDLHIDGESTEVDAPPDIIDVPGEDDDISDDEDPLPHDLADSDVEDLINDDDGVEKMADVARAHGGDGGGEDPSRPPPPSFGCAGCFVNRGKGKRKPNLGGVKAGRKTRERTRNQQLKDAVAANKGRPIEIGFEDRADNTVVPTGPYSTQWGNYFGEMIRGIPLYYPSWQKVPAGDKARLMATLGTTYNLEPHMRSERWPRIDGYIQAQFGKTYNTNKATLKREHWIKDPETGAYDLDQIRRGKPDEYTDDEWEKYINFWNDPANAQRAETNRLNRSKSTVVSRHGSRSIPLTRHLMKQASATQEEPSEIDTFYRLHTVNGVFQDPEALRMYDRMRELEATGEHTTAEINAMVRGGKLRGHIPGVGPVLPGYVRSRLSYSAPVDRSNDVDFMMSLMRSDDRFADAFARYDSGGASGSGGSRARDSEGGEDGDDTGREDGGDDTIVVSVYRQIIKKICMSLGKGDSKRQNSRGASVDKSTNIKVTPSDMSLGKLPLKDKTVEKFPPMSLGNLVPPWHQFLDQKIRGAHFSLRIVAGERFVIELTPSMFSQRHVAGEGVRIHDSFHVAGKIYCPVWAPIPGHKKIRGGPLFASRECSLWEQLLSSSYPSMFSPAEHVAAAKGQQLEVEGDENENVLLYYYITDNIKIQFGREEFCLVTGLRFGVENLADYNDGELPIPFRRRVFPSSLDGEHITCKYGVEGKRRIPDWMLRLANDRVGWDNYPWGSYVWPTLYSQLKNANVRRWPKLYATQPTTEIDKKSYSIFGYTWAFKGNMPAARLTPDETEARSDWWISSRAYFDGGIGQAERVPRHLNRQNMYEVPSEFYRQFEEQKRDLEKQKRDIEEI
ncbi:F-box domain containing protein [Tanacetum coccineum]|uniref:F-box domain containing protein n=1 Tax=Tanacetum coccineum TaxID=301880 RepID=A0ABQ4Z8E2_9ASTR